MLQYHTNSLKQKESLSFVSSDITQLSTNYFDQSLDYVYLNTKKFQLQLDLTCSLWIALDTMMFLLFQLCQQLILGILTLRRYKNHVKVSTQFESHRSALPCLYGKIVIPSSHLPFLQHDPIAISHDGNSANVRALIIISLIWKCLECLLTSNLFKNPCLVKEPKVTPQGHLCSWYIWDPNRMAQHCK